MERFAKGVILCCLLAACADPPASKTMKPSVVVRGVDSGTRQVVDDYYSVEPGCSNPGYPEIKFLAMPSHGTAVAARGEVYPGFPKDNVRYECNRSKVPSSQVLYESQAGFHGHDSFTVEVRFANSIVRLVTYNLDVL